MREHPVKGYEIASKIEMLKPIMPRGAQPPRALGRLAAIPTRWSAEDIPLAARIVAIADAFDAMATDRPYKAALPLEECEAVLRKTAGKMYDPELIEVFVSRHLGALYRDDYEYRTTTSSRRRARSSTALDLQRFLSGGMLMRETRASLPLIFLIAATRGMAGVGLGFLLADR